MKSITDRPMFANHIKNMDRMVTELSPYMTDVEIDKCVEYLHILDTTKFDTNPTVDDCRAQLELMLGKQRFDELTKQWNQKNQNMLKVYGKKKYKSKVTGILYDGLDADDNPDFYDIVYI